MREKTDEWAARIRSRSNVLRDFYTEMDVDDSFGWGGRVQMLCRRAPGKRPSGLLFTGQDGCGKHTAAAFAVDALREEEYGFIFLEGSDLQKGSEGFQTVSEKLGVFLNEYYDSNAGLCLILEDIEQSDCMEEFLYFLGVTLAEYDLQADVYPPLFVILISREEPSLPALLRRQLLTCTMNLPDLEHRRIFLANRGKEIKKYVNLEQTAVQTQGYSYAQLRDLLENLLLIIDSDEESMISVEDVEKFIGQQKPEAKTAQPYEKVAFLMEELLRQSGEFLLQLPQLIESIGSRTVPLQGHISDRNPFSYSEQNAFDQKNLSQGSEQPDRDRIEAMPVKQLAQELFGRELYEQIIHAQTISN